MNQTDIKKRLRNGLLLGFLVFVFVLMLYSLLLAFEWLKKPFLGAFLEPAYVLNPAPIYGLPETSAIPELGSADWQQLVALDHQALEDSTFPDMGLSTFGPLTLTLQSDTSVRQEFVVSTAPLPFLNQILYFFLPTILGWFFFAIALLAYKNQLLFQQKSGTPMFFGSLALLLCTLFDILSTHKIVPIWIAALVFSSAGLFHIAIQKIKGLRISNQIIGLAYLLAFAAAFLTWIKPYGLKSPAPFLTYISGALFFSICLFSLSFILFLIGNRALGSQSERKFNRVITAISMFTFAPLWIWSILFLAGFQTSFRHWLLIPLLLFPPAYLILHSKYPLLNEGGLQDRDSQTGTFSILLTLGYGFLVSGAGLIFLYRENIQNPFISAFLLFLFAVSVFPLKSYLEKLISSKSGKFEKEFGGRLNSYGSDLKALSNLEDIVNLLRLDIQEVVQAQYVHVFLLDPNTNCWRATRFGKERSSDLVFDKDSELVNYLSKETKPQYFKDFEQLPSILKPDIERIKLLGTKLILPVHGQKQLLGWVAMSNRLDGEPFSEKEIGYLNSVVDQTSLAIERSLVIDSLERSNIESNILARVAQGVNYTIALDDIYEFVFTQVSQLFRPDQFIIVLKGTEGNSLVQVFFVENSERIYQKENMVIPSVSSFENKVIAQSRAFFAEDYLHECAENGFSFIRDDLTSALFVPLNTGAESIGLFILGQSSEAIRFSDEQISFLQALADQVAGAIIRAKILQESERRAQQLAKLNTLTQKLTATLSLNPLYQNILNIGMEIIGTREGTFYLADPVSKELVVQVADDANAKTLLGKRIPFGTSIAGIGFQQVSAEVINQPIENSVSDGKTDNFEKPSFSILSVPLISKDQVIGVVELKGRLDGLPFTRNDQEILTAFAAQASIAIDNANLYSSTDLALTNRVEELSIMQRIDRELNITLDLQRVLDITLHWAIRQSKAKAGFIGLVKPEGMRIDIYEGYETDKLSPYLNRNISSFFSKLDEILGGGLPEQKLLSESDTRFFDTAKLQVFIPVRRKEQTLAFIFLEFDTPERLGEQEIDFLVRLSDHASIALVNGQLYSEVRMANVAKSEFVSLVAHELKNPMTSIKGYTELLAGGAVGEVNEAQSNFLMTIRSNVDRMNTLVSDLNDLTKIEAGRLRLDFKPVDLEVIVDDVIRSNKRLTDEKQQKFEILIPQPIQNVWADPTRLSQVLINIVSNAIKYSGNGAKIVIGAERETVKEVGQMEQAAVHIWVQDQGIGINPEDQKKIFQKFFRSEDPKTREVSGTGLGLNITKSMVELQGGKIWFESEFRKGSTFHLLIPVSNENKKAGEV